MRIGLDGGQKDRSEVLQREREERSGEKRERYLT
jgi:hypothetical protein